MDGTLYVSRLKYLEKLGRMGFQAELDEIYTLGEYPDKPDLILNGIAELML